MSSVRILCAQGERPVMVDGIVSAQTEHAVSVHCSSGADSLVAGSKVVVTVNGESGTRRCVIDDVSPSESGGHLVELVNEAMHESDKRDFPRLYAGLPVRYRQVSPEEADAWSAGEAIGGDWTEPDPYMNFSVGGLRFDCTGGLNGGDLVAIELQVGESGSIWRATGRVVRTFDATGDRPPSAAVAFESLPPAARDALSELTLQIQETLL